MSYSASQIAALTGGRIIGDPEVKVVGPCGIEYAEEEHISFLGNPKYSPYLYTTKAGIVIVPSDLHVKEKVTATLIAVPDVYQALAILINALNKPEDFDPGISPQAVIHPSVSIPDSSRVEHFVVIEEGAIIGDKVNIHSQVYIGKNVKIGSGTIIYNGARIMSGCQIGERAIIHQNAVIGSHGFGFARDELGRFSRIPHAGKVIIGNEVEVGANTAIDRGSVGDTVIGDGVKIDNLVHIAHNVHIGKDSAIAAQTGIAGSTRIGQRCLLGGQVGVSGHLTLADETEIQAQSGVASSIDQPGTKLFGYPAFEYSKFVRSHAVFKQLPELSKTMRKLEKLFSQDNNK